MPQLIKRFLGSALGLALMLGLAVTFQAAELVQAPTAAAATSSAKSAKVKLPKRCTPKGKRVLCADKTRRKLYYVDNGRIRQTLDARFGCAGSRHTREGTFKVYRKNKHWVSTIYHTPMPYSMFFSGGQAVHYSSDFAARGYWGCSHGCVNVRNMTKLKWVYAHIRVGDRVVVYRS